MSRILIVEDDRSVASMLEDFLDTLGFRTRIVADGCQAVEQARKWRPDLIIMDLMLPRLTGGEAAQLLKHDPKTAGIPILAISGVAAVQEFEEVLEVDGILPKPFDLHDLNRRVHALLPHDADDETPVPSPAW